MFKEIIILVTLLVAVALAMHPVEENDRHRLLSHHAPTGHHLKTNKHHSHGQEHIQQGKLAVPALGPKQHTKSAAHKKHGQSKAARLVQGHKKHQHLQSQSNKRSKSRKLSHDAKPHSHKRHTGSRRHF
ncbi:uncharacterized protein DMAD_11867 [Drosophila madeirensis]|uniref:Uncharacterized protein n=1 Tax=Drosophila madeirensis TaxID=30013 RepID=A0AAU9FEP1_DROMD